MAEERNLTTTTTSTDATTAADATDTEATKQELHQRMEQARDSISQTVSEIKETVTNKVEKISDDISRAVDWREYVHKRPLTFSIAALAVGFTTGALLFGGDDDEPKRRTNRRSLAASTDSDEFYESAGVSRPKKIKPVKEGPSLFEKVTESDAFHRLQAEATKIGDRLVNEVVTVGNEVLLPAVVGKLREVVEEFIPGEKAPAAKRQVSSASTGGAAKSSKDDSTQKSETKSDKDDVLSQSKTNNS